MSITKPPEHNHTDAGDLRSILWETILERSAAVTETIHDAKPGLVVTNTSVDNIPADADVVVCQRVLADRAKACAPNAALITIGNFLADPHLDNLYAALTSAAGEETAPAAEPVPHTSGASTAMNGVLCREGVKLGCASADKYTAIREAGALLAKLGCVDESYIDAMVQRENLVSTYMGMGVAIPHGTSQKKGTVKKSGVVLLQYPEGVDFGDEKAYGVILSGNFTKENPERGRIIGKPRTTNLSDL